MGDLRGGVGIAVSAERIGEIRPDHRVLGLVVFTPADIDHHAGGSLPEDRHARSGAGHDVVADRVSGDRHHGHDGDHQWGAEPEPPSAQLRNCRATSLQGFSHIEEATSPPQPRRQILDLEPRPARSADLQRRRFTCSRAGGGSVRCSVSGSREAVEVADLRRPRTEMLDREIVVDLKREAGDRRVARVQRVR